MEKRSFCANVNPVSSVIKAWSIELATLVVPEGSDSNPVSHSCTLDHFLATLRDYHRTDLSLSKIEDSHVACDALHLLPLLPFNALHCLMNVLSTFGEVEVAPNGRGGLYIAVVFGEEKKDLFEKLAND